MIWLFKMFLDKHEEFLLFFHCTIIIWFVWIQLKFDTLLKDKFYLKIYFKPSVTKISLKNMPEIDSILREKVFEGNKLIMHRRL